MKNRNILYGYQYVNGAVAIHPEETKVVKDIFNEYLNGKSLLKISDRLNSVHIEYMPGIFGWNKSRIKRLIEDERYLGAKDYPPIIDEDTHKKLIQIKSTKNTQKNTNRKAKIFNLGVSVLCSECGNRMLRQSDKRCKVKERWLCQNDECKHAVRISDDIFFNSITECLNTVINNPEVITNNSDTSQPNLDVLRLESEISRMLDNSGVDKNTLRKKMVECVSLKYRNIDSQKYISEKLKADFVNASPLSAFSMDLFSRTVKAINLSRNGIVSIVLMNDQEIGKEQSDDTNSGNG